MMNKTIYLLLILLLIPASYGQCQVAFDNYVAINTTELFRVVPSSLNTTENVYMLEGENEHKFSFNNDTDEYNLYITNAIEEDIQFLIIMTNSSGSNETCLNSTMKWRIPFNVTINLYSLGSLNNSAPTPYLNDFNYVILTPEINNPAFGSGFIETIDTLNSFFYGDTLSTPLDTSLSFWDKYSDGQAIITLYEEGNYTLRLGVSDTIYSADWKYEFIYPQFDNVKYLSDVTEITISDEANQELKVYADRIEIDAFNFYMNFVWAFCIFMAWLVVVGLVAYFLDGKIGLVIGGSTFPILLGIILGLF